MEVTLEQARTHNLRVSVRYPGEIDGPHTVTCSNLAMATVLSQDDSGMDHEVIYELYPVAGSATLSGYADVDPGSGKEYMGWSVQLHITADTSESVQVTVGDLIPKAEVVAASSRRSRRGDSEVSP